ncbi:hypothetical protein OUZ56_028743 [Daphnia magna]|uniref:Uncharacterized protein n=1 Tax=Daphnia magna TaxID=35525 RepID=A0ABR0B4U2_9CRUS|nr:hypothetical protein OUZ56_028743 [Daphnia magna]
MNQLDLTICFIPYWLQLECLEINCIQSFERCGRYYHTSMVLGSIYHNSQSDHLNWKHCVIILGLELSTFGKEWESSIIHLSLDFWDAQCCYRKFLLIHSTLYVPTTSWSIEPHRNVLGVELKLNPFPQYPEILTTSLLTSYLLSKYHVT